ncbi:spore protease YyaC [Alicyclobacillus fastidiosus]|uniref:Spore protease YyaC n=1 Tax=Alicyclobacillus fastidiosus TaxID=392011 RepID=A0ABV5AF57_9BACL|nr:spore protease YyaC [Alicyclobacillus fastidiosus]WEH09716.1 spore protease YyaC [Alicyclobacillus fastidiosus]
MKNSQTDFTEVPAGGVIGRVAFDEQDAARQLEEFLDQGLTLCRQSQILVVCVGTDRSTGDAFGPIIGSRMRTQARIPGVEVLGTLDEPVHAVNLGYTLERIQERYKEAPFIIAMDACLGKFDHVGHITVEQGPLRPGAGVKKSLPEFGDLTVTGIVNVSGFMEYFVLQNTRLGIVMKMCDIVVQSLHNSLQKHQITQAMRLGV